MTRLLAIDTSTEACSVAIVSGGEMIDIHEVIPRQHAQRLMPMIKQLMAQAQLSFQQLDAIAFGRGPGAFTGLRIAAAVTQGLAYASHLPVIPISTLAAMAQGAICVHGATHVLSAIDARMSEVYWACYEERDGVALAVSPEKVSKPSQVLIEQHHTHRWMGVGTGCAFSNEFQMALTHQEVEWYPLAKHMLTLACHAWVNGGAIAPEQAQPIYLRDDVTHHA